MATLPIVASPGNGRRAKEFQRGAESSNTPPATRHEGQKALETGGEDTAVISFGVVWGEAYEKVMEALQAARMAAEEQSSVAAAHIGDIRLAVHPGGSSSGGGKGLYYAFRAEAGGFALKLSKQVEPKGDTPNVLVSVGACSLMVFGGLDKAFEEAKRMLCVLGGKVAFAKLSRVDVCVDLVDEDVSSAVALLMQGHSVCRARKRDYHQEGDRWLGFTVGRGDCLVRVYDKAYEVTVSKPDAEKRHYLEEHRWGKPCERAVRVEFQLRREALKERGIDSVEDYLECRGALLGYLVREWFRLAAAPVDRENRHQDRAALHLFWERVCSAFESWASLSGVLPPRVVKRLVDTSRLVRQAVGCFMSARSRALASRWEGVIEEPSQFVQELMLEAQGCVEKLGERYFDAYGMKLLAASARCAPGGCV